MAQGTFLFCELNERNPWRPLFVLKHEGSRFCSLILLLLVMFGVSPVQGAENKTRNFAQRIADACGEMLLAGVQAVKDSGKLSEQTHIDPLAHWDQSANNNIQKVLSMVIAHSQSSLGRKIAVFAAEGTLWRGEMGAEFFSFLRKKLSHESYPFLAGSWQERVSELGEKGAYTQLLTAFAGVHESVYRQWVREFVAERSELLDPIYAQRLLIKLLQENEFEVFVVSPLPYLLMSSLADELDIPKGRFVATECLLTVDGQLSSEIDAPVALGNDVLVRLRLLGVDKPWAAEVQNPIRLAVGSVVSDLEFMNRATMAAIALDTYAHGVSDERALAQEIFQREFVTRYRRGLTSIVPWFLQKF